MSEDDSDSDDSDTELEDTMVGPSADTKGPKREAQDAKAASKNDMVSDLTSFHDTATPVQPR